MDFATAEIKPETFPQIKIMNSLGFKICSQLLSHTMRVIDKFENTMAMLYG